MTDRRRKARASLDPDDERLWRYVTRSVKPLEGRFPPVRPVYRPAPPPSPEPGGATVARPPAGAQKTAPRMSGPHVTVSHAPEPLEGPPNAQWARRMRRGDVVIDARLDLHGLTQTEAHNRLLRFVAMAIAQRLRVLLVITGKGTRSGPNRGETGVLRRSLPHWLKHSGMGADILAITPAHRRHGGTGAYYVALRRSRD